MIVSVASFPSVVFPVIERAGAVSVPVNVGEAELDFVATAVAILSHSLKMLGLLHPRLSLITISH